MFVLSDSWNIVSDASKVAAYSIDHLRETSWTYE